MMKCDSRNFKSQASTPQMCVFLVCKRGEKVEINIKNFLKLMSSIIEVNYGKKKSTRWGGNNIELIKTFNTVLKV